MKANKRIKTTELIDIDITEITLLSKEEYEEYKDRIPKLDGWWWLRSPGYDSSYAASVYYGGFALHNGNYVDRSYGAVRPALRISNLESSNLSIGDVIRLFGYEWTVISDELAICNEEIGYTYFRKDWRAEDANVYEKSDIKKWLESWWKERAGETE